MERKTAEISPELLRAQRRSVKKSKILACAGRHAPGLCRYLRLSAGQADSKRIRGMLETMRLRHRGRGGGRGLHRHQHLRHPRARGGPRVRQRRCADAYESPPSAAEDLPLRLHDGSAGGRRAHQKSYRHVDGVFNPTICGVSRSCCIPCSRREARLCHRGLRRSHRGGPPVVRSEQPSRRGSRSCTAATISARTASCRMCADGSVRAVRRRSSPRSRLIAAGYDITLLGQNVNSYGKDLGLGVDFADLLGELAELPGEFWLRFMTSHPKDATKKLFDTIASHERSPSSSTCRSNPATTACSRS